MTEVQYPNEVQRFYYETLNWCGCGNPNEALGFMRDVLTIMKSRKDDNEADRGVPYEQSAWAKHTVALNALLGDGMLGMSYLYTLDSHGLLEHGSSIGGSWLTGEGERVLAMLQSHNLEAALGADIWDEDEATPTISGGEQGSEEKK